MYTSETQRYNSDKRINEVVHAQLGIVIYQTLFVYLFTYLHAQLLIHSLSYLFTYLLLYVFTWLFIYRAVSKNRGTRNRKKMA